MSAIKKLTKFLFLLTLAAVLISSKKLVLSPVDPDPFMELMRIQDAYGSSGGVWSTWLYDFDDYEDNTLIDFYAQIASLRIDGEKFRFSTDSIVSLQDGLYNVTIYPDDSVIYVRPPVDLYKTLIQADLLDTLLQLHQIHNISFSTSGFEKTITFEFKNESPYIKYSVTYDTCNYFLQSIDIYSKKSVVAPGLAHIAADDYEDYTRLQISALSHTVETQSANYFATGQYIKRQNRTYVGVGSYVNYVVVDHSDE
jgi:hypothetical protein